MIFVDSNIPMYLRGAAHPLKTEAQILVERCIAAGERLVSDAEVLQEILHRFTATNHPEAIGPTMETLLELVDEIFPVEKDDVLRAAEMAPRRQKLSARDALHFAIMKRYRVTRIMSFDSDFDRCEGITRVHAV